MKEKKMATVMAHCEALMMQLNLVEVEILTK